MSPASPPAPAERSRLLLRSWRAGVQLSGRERTLLAGPLHWLDLQLQRLERGHLHVAAFGRVGVGKSSLLNALLGKAAFATDVAHGCTRRRQGIAWQQAIAGLSRVELVDTPGIDELGGPGRARLAARVALAADLVLLVLDGDLTRVEAEALGVLLDSGKPLLLVLNRCDCWPEEERAALLASIRRRLPPEARGLELLAVAAAPHRPRLLADGRVRSEAGAPEIDPLRRRLLTLLAEQGDTLLALNALRAADRFHQLLLQERLRHGRRSAQGLIGRFAALKATGVAANPLLLLDLAGGMACDTALVLQLCRLYGIPMQTSGARALLARLSGQNALLGGSQLAIQLLLSGLRQLLVLAAPFSGGLSLAPAAPVAMAQAALAVHTTRRTGRLAAAELLRTAQRGGRPGSLLRRLAQSDPELRRWLGGSPLAARAGSEEVAAALPALLP